MKQRLLFIFVVLVALTSITSAIFPATVSAISETDTTSGEEAADRSADAWCGANADALVQDQCKTIFKDAYLGDSPVPHGRSVPTCSTGTQPGDACAGADAAGRKDRNKDWLEIPDGVCKAYINAAKGNNQYPAELKDLKDGDVDKAVNSCAKGFNLGIGSATGSCSGSFKTACEGGRELANLHIFTSTEAKGHAKGQSIDEINSGADTGDTEDGPPSCESSSFSLSWILCGIINGLASAVDGIFSNLIQPLLVTKPIDVTSPADDPTHTYAIWSNFRIYGNVFLVIALLVIVFGESIGGGMIDAYAAKKILPRLLLAAVLINLSIYIVAIAVDVTNILGNGLEALIEAPFRNADGFTLRIGEASSGIGLVALVGGGIWAAAALAPLLEFLFLFFLIPAFLTFLAIMVTVLVRQGLILFLVFAAPIAFALYCLPNTEKYFKQWWSLLVKTLMIYPIIAVSFGLANVMTVTINQTTSGVSKTFADFLAIFCLFVPLFLIPYSFKIAGGLLGQLHEMSAGLGKRGSEAIKGNAQDPSSWRNKAKGKMAMRNAELGMDGQGLKNNLIPFNNPMTKSGRSKWREQRQAHKEATAARLGAKYADADATYQANKGNDMYLDALANPERAQKRRLASTGTERAAWDQAFGAAAITHKSPAVRMQAAQALMQTGYQTSGGQQGYNETAEMFAGITGAELTRDEKGNVTGATGKNAASWVNAMNFGQYNAKAGGRFDLGGINHGSGYSFEGGVSKASGYTAGQAKPKTFAAGAEHFMGAELQGDEHSSTAAPEVLEQEVRKKLMAASTPEERKAALNGVAEWHGKLLEAERGATGANQAEIENQLKALGRLTSNEHMPDDLSEDELTMRAELDSRFTQNKLERRGHDIDPNLREDG